MTVSTVVDHNDYTGNGVTISFPYTFRIFKKTDLTVSVIDLSENITVLVLDTDYTVTNAGGYNGGSVVLTAPLTNGWQISIARELEPTQETDLRNQGKFFAEVHEDAFDKLTMLIQQAYSVFRLALRKPSSIANWYDALGNYIRNVRDPSQPQDAATKIYVDNSSASNNNYTDELFSKTVRTPEAILSLPSREFRKNKLVGMNDNGDPIMVLPESGSASDVLIELAKQTGAGLSGYNYDIAYPSGTVGYAIKEQSIKKTINAQVAGVVDSLTIDSTAALQALIDMNPEATIILPTNIAISSPIKYYSYTDIRGRNSDQAVVNMLPGFTGGVDAFMPADTSRYAVQYSRFTDILIVDRSATAVGKGTDSTKRGINLLGTFGVQIRRVNGSRLDRVITCAPGPLGVNQHTARPFIEEINGSNVNHIIKFDPATDNRTPYGDIFLNNIKTTGSCKYGVSIEDADGLTWTGAVLFPDSQIRVSGGYINISVAHPFEAKAKLTDTGNSAESLLIPARAGGDKTYYVNISGLASNYAGRLMDNSSGAGDVVNKGAYGIKLINVQVFNINATINHPSMGGMHMINCSNGNFSIATRNVNVQGLGSGALPAGTYDSVRLEGCTSVIGRISDLSPAKNYTVYMDDSCVGCTIDGTASSGAVAGRFVRIPLNRQNHVSINAGLASGYRTTETGRAEYNVLTVADNTAAPSPTYQNEQVVEFSNTSTTNVTDIPSVLDRQTVIVNLRNGNTTLVSENNGGLFVFTGTTSNQQGAGKCFQFYRDPDTHKLRQL